MTDKRTLQLNFIVATLLLGTAAGLLFIFGVTNAVWYIAAKQTGIGIAFWVVSYAAGVGCIYALIRISKKLKKKMALMAT